MVTALIPDPTPYSASRALVHDVLAAYLQVDGSAVRDGLSLDRDLGLDPLDLVLVVLRLQDAHPAGKAFALPALASASTVADLVALFDACWDRDTIEDLSAV
jgi:hypothetical protein